MSLTPPLPDEANLRLGILSLDPMIVLGTLDFSTEARNFTHPRVREMLGDRPATLLAMLPWSHGGLDHVAAVANLLHEQASSFPRQTVHILCNAPYELDLFRRHGVAAHLINHNAFIDQSLFHPILGMEKRFDAIYVASMEPFKRHQLMSGLRSGVLAYSRLSRDAEHEAYYASVRRALKNCLFANQPSENDPYALLPSARIAELYGQSRVGLCLSASEGAMRASMEYLLSGLPVVTTPSDGGRDVFFDPAYTLTVEPDPEAVARGVRELIDRDLSPLAIRAATLCKVSKMRQQFVNLLREIHDRAERPFPPVGHFRDPFRHPYEDSFLFRQLEEKLAEARARHEAALTLDPP